MKSLVTIDVEGHPDNRTYDSIDLLDQLLDGLSVPTTLFVTPDVVRARPERVGRWMDGPHAVGMHVHPERLGGQSPLLSEYGESEIAAMLQKSLATFEETLGVRPAHFRAGRWEYSEQLLVALDQVGIDRDASLVPDYPKEPYSRGDVLELPLSVYSNPLVEKFTRYWDTTRIPLWADWFLPKKRLLPGFYAVTWRILKSDRRYVMTALHDYDILAASMWGRTRQYIEFLTSRTVPATVLEI